MGKFTSETERKQSQLEDKTQQLSKKVWDVDTKQPVVVDVNEYGIDSRLVNQYDNGTIITGKDHADNINTYLIKDNRIYKSDNFTEV